ncbi:ATP-binding protein [Natroniella acetigena]|uniref:ATP-binding protein n=1 Tax=Natroniella acetigena TaxID=52004 RepID=UPI00200B2E39|nr:DnaA/Hda family protein [Natroniella acetigena]
MKSLSSQEKCPYDRCNGSGLEFTEVNGRQAAIECECREEKLLSKKLEFATIIDEFQGTVISDYKADSNHYEKEKSIMRAKMCKKSAQSYVSRFEEMKRKKKGLYFYSKTPGSGKTMIISAIGNELVQEYKATVKFATAGDLLNAIRSTYGNSDINTHELIDAARKVEVLILDDMGQQSIKSDTNDHLFDILNHRINRDTVTIFSSNCKIEDLPYNFRIRDRITKMAIPIEAPNESVRKNLAQQENDELLRDLLVSKG